MDFCFTKALESFLSTVFLALNETGSVAPHSHDEFPGPLGNFKKETKIRDHQ